MTRDAVTELPDADGLVEPEAVGGPDHPMRKVTREVAFEAGWSTGRAAKVAELFDSLAPEWSTRRVDGVKAAPLLDAIERGGVTPTGRWVELGSGTGAGSQVLARYLTGGDRAGARGELGLVTLDLSAQMLANAPAIAPRVQGDASRLPFPDDAAEVVLAINMLLFPDEVDRILAPGGALLWINTLGDRTPIHLPVGDVLDAMPGSWRAVTARAGSGFWAAVRRVDDAA
ncbi:MAG: class I SAM-dependent methyltransferase [Actinomycetota bacterium]